MNPNNDRITPTFAEVVNKFYGNYLSRYILIIHSGENTDELYYFDTFPACIRKGDESSQPYSIYRLGYDSVSGELK